MITDKIMEVQPKSQNVSKILLNLSQKIIQEGFHPETIRLAFYTFEWQCI